MFNPHDMERYPKRKNPRLKNYDYSSEGIYFITICTHEKKCLFSQAGQHALYGSYAAQGFRGLSLHYPNVVVDKFVVMPNHVHAILVIQKNTHNLARVIGSYKSFVTKKIHEIQPNVKVWQTSFHDHIIRNEKSYQMIWQYVDSNPMNWEKDCFYDNKM